MSDYTPPPDDVEAAAKAMLCPEDDWEGSRAAAKEDVTAAMLCLHARGWRDPAEVAAITYLRTRLDAMMAAHTNVIAERDALAAKLAEAERITDGLSVAHVLAFIRERDRAEARAARLRALLSMIVESGQYRIRAKQDGETLATTDCPGCAEKVGLARAALPADTAEKEKA